MSTIQAVDFTNLDEANDWLAESFRFVMFGEVDYQIKLIEYEDGTIFLAVVNQFARDSREYDWDNDGIDDWTLFDSKTQTSALQCDEWQLKSGLIEMLPRVVASAMAHEALEWLVDEEGEMLHDPHVNGNPKVVL